MLFHIQRPTPCLTLQREYNVYIRIVCYSYKTYARFITSHTSDFSSQNVYHVDIFFYSFFSIMEKSNNQMNVLSQGFRTFTFARSHTNKHSHGHHTVSIIANGMQMTHMKNPTITRCLQYISSILISPIDDDDGDGDDDDKCN